MASPALRSFYAKNLKVLGKPITTKLPDMKGVAFGTVFAPHMLQADWCQPIEGKPCPTDGWSNPTITDHAPLHIDPQASCLHYGLQCFEGLKAYYCVDKTIRLFRPDMNAKRMNRSMTRLAFPTFDEEEWVKVLKELVTLDKSFVPREHGYSLYVRPTAIGTNQNLRVGPADKVKFFIIISPVGPYYPEGFKPVKLVADGVHKRAWPGGSGDNKLGANYAAPIVHQVAYAKQGYSQILWLGSHNEVEEVGAMNFMVLWKNKNGERELITAPLNGTILPGITRDSILQLCRGWNEFKVTEGTYYIDDVVEALEQGRVEEMFGCGTAAIVTAVSHLKYGEKVLPVPLPEKSVTVRCLNAIQDIQYGNTKHPWSTYVCDA